MCDPTGMSYVAIGMMVAGAAASAASAIKQGNDAKAMGDYNAQTAANSAQYAIDLGKYKESQQRSADAYKRGKMLTLFMKSGVTLDGASSAEAVMEEQSINDEMDALMIRSNYQAEANRQKSQAVLSRMEGDSAQTAGYGKGAGTLLGGLGGAAMGGYKAGMFGTAGTAAAPSKYMYIYDN